jgi:hypothetical protein
MRSVGTANPFLSSSSSLPGLLLLTRERDGRPSMGLGDWNGTHAQAWDRDWGTAVAITPDGGRIPYYRTES